MFGVSLFGGNFLELVRKEKVRKDAAAKRLKFYFDQQTDELYKALATRYAKPQDFRLFEVNAVKKIVNRRSTVYQGNPHRTFEGVDQETGEELYRSIKANIVLKKANRLTKLLKTTLLQVRWDEDAERVMLDIVTPNVADAFFADPERPQRFIVTHPVKEDAWLTTYSDWTAQSYEKRDHRGERIRLQTNPGGVNPYGVLPFVPLFDYHPDDEFWLPGGDDIINAQEAVNVALANLWRGIEYQTSGQAWASGIPATAELLVGPDRAVTLPENGKFGFSSPDAPIEEVLKAIEFVLKQTAVANDLAANIFELDPRAESGAAKFAEKQDLLEARADELELWRTYEAQLFEIIKTVWNTHRPGTIPEDATVAVDFAEVGESVREVEKLQAYQLRLDLGIASPVDLLMRDNPDIRTREDALLRLQVIRDENATLGVLLAPPSISGGEQ